MEKPSIFLVAALSRTRIIAIFGGEVTLPMTWAPGQIGVLPVFSTREAAEAYAGDSGAEIMEARP